MTIDPDTLDNDDLADLDLSTLDPDDAQDAIEEQNAADLNGEDGVAQEDLPDTDPPPSLDPTPVATGISTGTSDDGTGTPTGWVLTFDDDGAVRTTMVEDV
jgi:hypothetical protein